MLRNPNILINQMSFVLPNNKILFNDLTLTFSKQKTGLVGINGVGKSTLLRLIIKELMPTKGSIHMMGKISYVPQHFPISSDMTVAKLLGVAEKLNALRRIKEGSVNEMDFALLQEDWIVEEKIQQEINKFGLKNISLERLIKTLSAGQLTQLLLAKAFFSGADFLLLDEPTNHLDQSARNYLYHMIEQWIGGMIVVSHDRKLLNYMEQIVELSTLGVTCYGGNYDFYHEQKETETHAKLQQLTDAKKALHKTKRSIQSTKEKHEQRQAHGRELRRSGSQSKLILDAMVERSTRSQGEMLIRHNRMLDSAQEKLKLAQKNIEIIDEINIDLPKTYVPNSKILLQIKDLRFSYGNNDSLIRHFNLIMQGPERIALVGENGSGKTTLIKLIINELKPQAGEISLGTNHVRYLDQHLNLLNYDTSILENFLRMNPESNENDAYQALAKFLFKNEVARKFVKELSGGEKLRALLACVLMAKQPPQLLILDEPTNHLDLKSIQEIEAFLKCYQGGLIIISHDESFQQNVGVKRIIYAPFNE